MERTAAGSALSAKPAGFDYQPQRSGTVARLQSSRTGTSTSSERGHPVRLIANHEQMAETFRGNAGYAAVRDGGAGLIELSSRGHILVSGAGVGMVRNGLVDTAIETVAWSWWRAA